MPLSEQQLDAINGVAQSYNEKLVELISALDDVRAVIRIHEDLDAADAMAVVQAAKAKALTAAGELVTLLQ